MSVRGGVLRAATTAAITAAIAVAVAGLTGCAGSDAPAVTAAPSAADPGCTALLERLPATLLGEAAGTSPATGTAVWGEKTPIVLRCGVTPPGPSTDACINVNGIDWLFVDGKDDFILTTYGRTPATELIVPHELGGPKASGATAELTGAVTPMPVTRECTPESE